MLVLLALGVSATVIVLLPKSIAVIVVVLPDHPTPEANMVWPILISFKLTYPLLNVTFVKVELPEMVLALILRKVVVLLPPLK